MTSGDEFQGLLFNERKVFDIIQKIKMDIYPVEIRYGIGVGQITTSINTDMALGADGPGFYNARKAIDFLKKNEGKYRTASADIYLVSDDMNDNRIMLVNSIFELMKAIEETYTYRQYPCSI